MPVAIHACIAHSRFILAIQAQVSLIDDHLWSMGIDNIIYSLPSLPSPKEEYYHSRNQLVDV